MMSKSGTKLVDCPENLLEIIEKFIAKHPDLSYSSPSEFINSAIRNHLDQKYKEDDLLNN